MEQCSVCQSGALVWAESSQSKLGYDLPLGEGADLERHSRSSGGLARWPVLLARLLVMHESTTWTSPWRWFILAAGALLAVAGASAIPSGSGGLAVGMIAVCAGCIAAISALSYRVQVGPEGVRVRSIARVRLIRAEEIRLAAVEPFTGSAFWDQVVPVVVLRSGEDVTLSLLAGFTGHGRNRRVDACAAAIEKLIEGA